MQLSFSLSSKHGLKPKLTDANLANTIAVVSSAPASGTNVGHELHLFDVPDTICKQRLRERNEGGEHPFQVSEED